MASKQPQSSKTSKTTETSETSERRRSSAYDEGFEEHYIDCHIYPDGHDYRNSRETPEPNLEGLHQGLSKPRLSLSLSRFTTSDFQDFRWKNKRVASEAKVTNTLFPIISGKTDILDEGNLLFTELESMTDNVAVDPQLDFYDGIYLEDVDKKVRKELGLYIIPTDYTIAPVVPNFFMEAKAPSGGIDVAKRQAM